MAIFTQFDPLWSWWLAAIALAVAEIIVPGVFLIWLAIAAAITALIATVLPIGLPAEFGLFAVASLASVYLGKRVMDRRGIATTEPLLNERAARLIGRLVVIEEAIIDGRGRVRVGDGSWLASGPNLPAGATARVTGADGNVLLVESATSAGFGQAADDQVTAPLT